LPEYPEKRINIKGRAIDLIPAFLFISASLLSIHVKLYEPDTSSAVFFLNSTL
jgi:hypothetical protein